jgi:nitrous oxide reductase accessory protein NosL
MSKKAALNRRKMIKLAAVSGVGVAVFGTSSNGAKAKMKTAGTPRQFYPANGPDAKPYENDIEKYPKCPYCGMNRKMWNHSRHLIHYSDDMVDPTCSIHCVAISLALNLDREPKAIYAADYGAEGKIKPLVNVDNATYLIGSSLPGTMTKKSKMAFAKTGKAKEMMESRGGETGDFDFTLTKVYLGIAKDTAMIRKKRAAKRKKMKMSS